MNQFDYVIVGGGCSGLSLAYELEIHGKLKNKRLAIIEPRAEYKRDKTWSFWKFFPHNFDDCIIKSWDRFSIKTPDDEKFVNCHGFPYQTVDSGLFYQKITSKLGCNPNVSFFTSTDEIDVENAVVFNSVPQLRSGEQLLFQHFHGIEVETDEDFFDEGSVVLMDFDCEQRGSVHFFYLLPYDKRSALIETTWFSPLSESLQDYNAQLKSYIDRLGIKNYKIGFREEGAIPLFAPNNRNKGKRIHIGTAGGMTRLSTGYTFLNIQQQSKYIRENIDKIETINAFSIGKKYGFLDRVFLTVLRNNPHRMPAIFLRTFDASAASAIKFLSNKSSLWDDLKIVLKMPKWVFIKALFGR